MAEATSQDDCIERHRTYSIDVSLRLNALQRERLKRMVSAARPGDHVLDVGCNSGYIVDFLPIGCEVYGVDVSTELVAKAARRLVEAKIAAAEDLPFPNRCMDMVILGEILEHVHDPLVCLKEAARVTRRLVVGSTPHEAGHWGPDGKRKPETHRFHVRCFTKQTLAEVLEEAGLVDVEIGTVNAERIPQMYVFTGQVKG